MKPKPTDEQKAKDKQRQNLKIIHNRITSKFNFKEIQTWRDIFTHYGFSPEHIAKMDSNLLETKPTFVELRTFFQKETDELEAKLNGHTHVEHTVVPSSEAAAILEVLEEPAPKEQSPLAPIQVSIPAPKVELTKEEELLTSKDNYGYVPSPHISPSFFAYWFQKKAAAELVHKVVDEKKSGVLLLAPTGVGKTFMTGMLDRHLIDIEYHEGKTWSHIPRLFVTKRTVVEQASRVFKKFFNIEPNVDTEIINIEGLRGSKGKIFVKEEVYMEGGAEKSRWKWKNNLHPAVVYFDESQGAKNKGSTQSQIIYSYNELPPDKTCLVSISATPFTRVSEAQAFAVSTHRPLEHLGFPPGTILTNQNWPSYASIIAAPYKPDEYEPAAVKRLMDDLEDWVVRVKGVKPQFGAINGVRVIPFSNPEDEKFYWSAWTRFEQEKAKLAAAQEAGEDVGACRLVILLKFAMAAEMCHAGQFARDMFKCWQQGKAPVAAPKFKGTVIKIVQELEKMGISRDNISLIWGGGQTQLNEKEKAIEIVKKKAEKLKAMGIDVKDMLKDMGLEDVEERHIQELPAHLRLGPQDPRQRQVEIDNFQSGKTEFCIYTLKAGGVGLSLHHTDELTTKWNTNHPKFKEWYDMILRLPEKQRPLPGKVRRKESGYAVEEDIPFIPVRQRETFCTVSYNAIELVQGVGRVPRLTSLSTTVQNVYCYQGTVEMYMAIIYSQKLKCLTYVVKFREDWNDIMLSSNRKSVVDDLVSVSENAPQDESTLIDEGDEGDDE